METTLSASIPSELSHKRKRSNSQQSQRAPLLFPLKIFKIVEECPDIIGGWIEDGSAFYIKDVNRFEVEIIPQYYSEHKVPNFLKFVRQMSIYGFQKVKKEISSVETWLIFSHEFFKRNERDLLWKVDRVYFNQDEEEDDVVVKKVARKITYNTLQTYQLEIGAISDNLSEIEASVEEIVDQLKSFEEHIPDESVLTSSNHSIGVSNGDNNLYTILGLNDCPLGTNAIFWEVISIITGVCQAFPSSPLQSKFLCAFSDTFVESWIRESPLPNRLEILSSIGWSAIQAANLHALRNGTTFPSLSHDNWDETRSISSTEVCEKPTLNALEHLKYLLIASEGLQLLRNLCGGASEVEWRSNGCMKDLNLNVFNGQIADSEIQYLKFEAVFPFPFNNVISMYKKQQQKYEKSLGEEFQELFLETHSNGHQIRLIRQTTSPKFLNTLPIEEIDVVMSTMLNDGSYAVTVKGVDDKVKFPAQKNVVRVVNSPGTGLLFSPCRLGTRIVCIAHTESEYFDESNHYEYNSNKFVHMLSELRKEMMDQLMNPGADI